MATKLTDEFLLSFLKDDADILEKIVLPETHKPKAQIDLAAQGLQEVNEFIKSHGREPSLESADGAEYLLALRLKKCRGKKEKDTDASSDPFADPMMAKLMAGVEYNPDIYKFDNEYLAQDETKERAIPDYIAKRRPCPDFDEKYRDRFEKVESAIKEKHRKLIPYSIRNIQEGNFGVIGGVIFLVDAIYELKKTRGKDIDGRTRIIFSNGTEANLKIQSIMRGWADRGGYSVSSDDRDDPNTAFRMKEVVNDSGVMTIQGGTSAGSVTKEDIGTGYIYVLRSLSDEAPIKAYGKDLYKIGCTRGTVENRIRNASHETTYLCANVKPIMRWKVMNINTEKLETLIHHFFGPAQVLIKVRGEDGTYQVAKEWYSLPLEVINQTVPLILNGTIGQYLYDPKLKAIVKRADCTSSECNHC